jgi:GT2 family glycosyltransferase
MASPRLSIAFVAYNQESFVEAALLAALNQEGPGYEVVIGEDASTDGTRARIEASHTFFVAASLSSYCSHCHHHSCHCRPSG